MKNDHLIKAVARRLRIQNRSPVINPDLRSNNFTSLDSRPSIDETLQSKSVLKELRKASKTLKKTHDRLFNGKIDF